MQQMKFRKMLFISLAFLIGPAALNASAAQELNLPALGGLKTELSLDEFDELLKKTRRWGEFGDDDQTGAINLITPEKRIVAAAEVRVGRAISLANPISKTATGEFVVPLVHETFVFPPLAGPDSPEVAAGDIFTINYHGALHSHMDGVSHFGWEGQLYNGFPFKPGDQGFSNVGLEHIADKGIFTRGVLVDLPSLYGIDSLEPGTVITVQHLEAWEKAMGVKVSSGDVLLVRTGRWALAEREDEFNVLASTAGLHATVGPWLKERGVAAIGSDAISDVMPGGVESVFNPLHVMANYALGMPIFDHLQLDELAEVAKEERRYSFLFTASPLHIQGATGSPLTPFAHF